MKQLLFIFLLAYTTSVLAQTTTSEMPALKNDYLKKSRTQKTIAWSLLGGGTVLVVAGISVALQDVYLFSFDQEGSHYQTGTVLFTMGGTAMLGSIPLFIMAAKNKSIARNASAGLKMDSILNPQHPFFVKSSYPAFSLKFNLR
jgi:hypothetical protein